MDPHEIDQMFTPEQVKRLFDGRSKKMVGDRKTSSIWVESGKEGLTIGRPGEADIMIPWDHVIKQVPVWVMLRINQNGWWEPVGDYEEE